MIQGANPEKSIAPWEHAALWVQVAGIMNTGPLWLHFDNTLK